LAWWSQKIDELTMNKGRAECGIDIWNRFAVAYQYEGLGIRAFYPKDSEIPGVERALIEKYFMAIDRDYFYEFVQTCYEQYRAIATTPSEPLTVTVSPQIVELFEPVWIEITGTKGLADIEIYVDDQLVERYENQSVPQRGQYIPKSTGTYKIVVKHKTTNEIASASFIVKYTPPPEVTLPEEKVVVEVAPPTPPTPQPPTPEVAPPTPLVERPRPNILAVALLGYIIYEVFKRR